MLSHWMILDGPDGYDLYQAFIDGLSVNFKLAEYNRDTLKLTGRTGEISIIPTILKRKPRTSELELVGEIAEDFIVRSTIIAKAKQNAGDMKGKFGYKPHLTSGRITLF